MRGESKGLMSEDDSESQLLLFSRSFTEEWSTVSPLKESEGWREQEGKKEIQNKHWYNSVQLSILGITLILFVMEMIQNGQASTFPLPIIREDSEQFPFYLNQ